MIKNRLKLSLAASLLVATCSYAGTVTAPNSSNIELSGDVELKAVSEKTDTEKINKRTAEVNLNLDATLNNGIKVFTTFKAFDGVQGQTTAGADNTDDGFKTKAAYAVIPLMDGKGKVVAGLAPNNTYGTDAFDNGGEDWKLAVNVPVAKGVKVTVVSKVKNEEEADSNKGDSGMTAIRVDAKIGELMIGAKYGSGYKNKDDGKVVTNKAIDSDNTEKEIDLLTAYINGSVAGLDLGVEYIQKDVELIGVNKTIDQKGFFATIGKSFGDVTAGIAYITLEKGLKGGDDFAPGMILDGNIDSSATKDTSAIVVPLEYSIDDSLTASATYISADVQGSDATEIDFGIAYAMDDNIELSAGYGKYTIDDGDDQTNIEVAIAITF
ncbi:MAG: hypothetical protein U9O56_10205 [Campylobacterota bacterium]|nr:hypothetical protein [Campylobacterota bacterium]